MTPRSCRLFLALAGILPLAAQTPLFTDGPALGGSKVFSEGMNPLGNAARFDQPLAGWYLTYLDGEQRAADNRSILQDAAGADAALASSALTRLADAPWALRTRAFGFAKAGDASHFSLTREEIHSAMAHPDLDPARLGSGLGINGTQVDGRHVRVDRMNFGGGSMASGVAMGLTFRVEQWSMGRTAAWRNPLPDQASLAQVDDRLLRGTGPWNKTLTYAIDMGFLAEVAEGLRLGLTADQLNAKRLWDVNLRPQFRAGLQIDLGSRAKLALEGDVNKVERMPFPVKQGSASASLRIATSSAVTLLLGAERRTIGDSSVTRGGITLQVRSSSFAVGVGFYAGQDSPLKGATLMVP
jgi:hypothetical protein